MVNVVAEKPKTHLTLGTDAFFIEKLENTEVAIHRIKTICLRLSGLSFLAFP